jgi:hypothetical protein
VYQFEKIRMSFKGTVVPDKNGLKMVWLDTMDRL